MEQEKWGADNLVQCKRCGIELRLDNPGEYCYPCQVDLETLRRQHKLCQRCGKIIQGRTGPNTKYCDDCKVIVRREQVRRDVKKHRKNGGGVEDKEQIRQRVEKHRERWNTILKQYRYDAIGNAYNEHGKLMNQYHTGKGTNNFGPHANSDFDKEMELVWKEKKRRGLV